MAFASLREEDEGEESEQSAIEATKWYERDFDLQVKRTSFFLVGAAQCGMATLHEGLRSHPQICVPASDDPQRFWLDQEPYHFCGDSGSADWLRVVSGDDYRNLLEAAPPNAKCGIATGWKLFSQDALQRMKEFEPNAKIVLMLCPPITWMRSWHHEMLRYAYEDQVDFGQALAMEKERSQGLKLPRYVPSKECLQYRKAARFSEQVKAYYELFGKDQVFVGLLEDMQDEEADFQGRLLEFLEVDSSVNFETSGMNDAHFLKGTHHFDLAVGRVVKRLPGGSKIKQWFTKSMEPNYRNLMDKIFAPMSDQSINSILEEELLEEFEEEVDSLSRLIGRDLSHWNTPRFPRDEGGHHH